VHQEWEAKDGSKRSEHQVIGNVTFGNNNPTSDAPAAEHQQGER
jgi:hypothetical protein